MIAQELQPIRSERTPLTLDQIRKAAPSAFATEAYSEMSDRYTHIPTASVIEGMLKNGFQPFAVTQSRTRIAEKREFTKHMIRFRVSDAKPALNEVYPEVVLINSHDGSSAYKLMAGLFRLVCSNGLVIADSLVGSASIRHSGNIVEEVAAASFDLIDRMPKVIEAVDTWNAIDLTPDEQGVFAQAAHTLRFADAEGKVNTPIQPKQLLQLRRRDDGGNNLWSTFNRVQENVLKGGLEGYNTQSARRMSTRGVKGIDQYVKLNKALWTLAEGMAALKQKA